MHAVVNIWLQQFASDCGERQHRLCSAETLRSVRYLADIHADPVIRSVARHEPTYRQLQSMAERRAEEILDKQIAGIRVVEDIEARCDAINRLRAGDWCFLRGNWPKLAYKAEREALRFSK